MAQNYTVEQFKQLNGTAKFLFSIFKRRDAQGNVTTVLSHNEKGETLTYVEPSTGEVKPLPKMVVKDTANNIIAFCSAAVAKQKLEGGKALENSYFEGYENASGSVSYTLRKVAASDESLSAE